MSPLVEPIISPSLTNISRQHSAASSGKSLTDLLIGAQAAASSSSVQLAEGPVEPVKAEGLRHARVKLNARHYKQTEFATQFLQVTTHIQIPGWSEQSIKPEDVSIRRVSGALTNAVFFVACESFSNIPTLLLRVYGPSSGSLISRPRELHILHKLSSVYHLGPQVYGTFENGRIEEYFHSTTLTAEEMRDPLISRWIGARMAEFHSVDIAGVCPPADIGPNGVWEPSVVNAVSSWSPPARETLALPNLPREVAQEIDLPRFEKEWKIYLQWVSKVEDKHAGSGVVFGHNDAQYGNLLRLTDSLETDEHRQIIVVDFEYAGPNPAAYDIGNHFHEWSADYHGSTPHLLNPTRYPTFTQRRNFYTSYIQHSNTLGKGAEDPVFDSSDLDQIVAALDYQVRVWSPASHAMWAIWGIVQARDDIENSNPEPEFDYIGYAKGRMASFRQEILDLGVIQR